MKRYVLTGGHGVGKSSVIAALELRGEHVAHEAAATLRRAGQAQGQPFPEDAADFESRALTLHFQRESRIPEAARRVFLDRGAPDHLAYARTGHWHLTGAEITACQSACYDLAFLTEPPPSGPATVDRVEAAFCDRLIAAIEGAYAETGTPVIRLPFLPVDERVAFILHKVRDGAATLTSSAAQARTDLRPG